MDEIGVLWKKGGALDIGRIIFVECGLNDHCPTFFATASGSSRPGRTRAIVGIGTFNSQTMAPYDPDRRVFLLLGFLTFSQELIWKP
jgi:hypothetical protein